MAMHFDFFYIIISCRKINVLRKKNLIISLGMNYSPIRANAVQLLRREGGDMRRGGTVEVGQ